MSNRPFAFVANSSWYLNHYRRDLLKVLSSQGRKIVSICPIDSSSDNLSSLTFHIPWRIKRSADSNLFSLIKSFVKAFSIIRVVSPLYIPIRLGKSNLRIVFTFWHTMHLLCRYGRLSKSTGLSLFIFKKYSSIHSLLQLLSSLFSVELAFPQDVLLLFSEPHRPKIVS